MTLSQDRKLAAIMFTDIVGFSSMMSKNESKAVELLNKKVYFKTINFNL